MDTVTMRIKRLIIRRPRISIEEILEELKSEAGPKPSEFLVASIRRDTRQFLKIMKEEGRIDFEV